MIQHQIDSLINWQSFLWNRFMKSGHNWFYWQIRKDSVARDSLVRNCVDLRILSALVLFEDFAFLPRSVFTGPSPGSWDIGSQQPQLCPLRPALSSSLENRETVAAGLETGAAVYLSSYAWQASWTLIDQLRSSSWTSKQWQVAFWLQLLVLWLRLLLLGR